ncbi:MAG: hypothetical protein IT318_23975 [Anaerolineales bacterium]|nr:hypothetical protein [Anaerolineales bacterium]
MSVFVVPALCVLVGVCVVFSVAAGAARWSHRAVLKHRPAPERDGDGYLWS